MNYFSPETAAARYAEGRPYFHANTIARITAFLQLEDKVDNALDIACGTGLSTKALLPIAKNIWGIDTSPEMLKRAAIADNIQYAVSSAEDLPFAEQTFDLLTVSSGVHWFNIESFLKEAGRVMKMQANLITYDNYFISEMEGVAGFDHWFPEVYLQKFPSPPREKTFDWSNENINAKGFQFLHEETFKNPVVFNKEKLILYFTTQSNITAAVTAGSYDYAEIEQWLDKELSPFFNDSEWRTVYFGNWIKYLRKIN